MSAPPRPRRRPWPDYRTVWRWHFYAGLFCIPFVCWLAVTGSIYLFRPQVEAWLDRPYAHLVRPAARAAPSAEIAAALASQPGETLHAYQLPTAPGDAAQILVGRGGEERRVYVHPRTLKVLKADEEDDRPMKVVFRLHGELLIGDRGSMLVELAASWAVVMLITGLYLWWPRQVQGLGGVLYPRLGRGRRLFWRDLHAVTGLWVSGLALLLLLSGLPWAKSWGGYLQALRHLGGEAVVRQDWTTGRASELAQRAAMDAGGMAGMAMEHAEHRMGAVGPPPPAAVFRAIDRVAPMASALHLAPPVLIAPPSHAGGAWTVRSDAQNRTLRATVLVDGASGRVIRRQDFAARPLIDRIVGVGIAAHEGQLFGWLNQALGLFTALSLLTVSVSAVVLWWRRRDLGVLGAPEPRHAPRFSLVLAGIVVGLGVLLPLLGASMIAVLAVERLMLRRVPPIRRWLGLRPPGRLGAATVGI